MENIDAIIQIKGMTIREILRKYFPVDDEYRIFTFDKPFSLRILHENGGRLERGNIELEIEEDIRVRVTDIEGGEYRWFVYTHPNGKQYGSAVMAMLNLHENGVIELEKI